MQRSARVTTATDLLQALWKDGENFNSRAYNIAWLLAMVSRMKAHGHAHTLTSKP